MNDIILYECFDFTVKLLERKDRVEVFKLLKPIRLNKEGISTSIQSMDRAKLKSTVMSVLTEDRYNAVGLYNDQNELIGISFSSILDEDDENDPWLGWFYIKDKYRNTKASVVFINYIINILYDGFTIQIGSAGVLDYEKLIESEDINDGYEIFKKDVGPRLKKICNKSKTERIYL
ncbi:MAG: hypothetical protein KAH01_07235 [Caldisericia bacterium]|nr:hypothetical protein [Caldisericia bacterium]